MCQCTLAYRLETCLIGLARCASISSADAAFKSLNRSQRSAVQLSVHKVLLNAPRADQHCSRVQHECGAATVFGTELRPHHQTAALVDVDKFDVADGAGAAHLDERGFVVFRGVLDQGEARQRAVRLRRSVGSGVDVTT